MKGEKRNNVRNVLVNYMIACVGLIESTCGQPGFIKKIHNNRIVDKVVLTGVSMSCYTSWQLLALVIFECNPQNGYVSGRCNICSQSSKIDLDNN